MHSGAVFSLRVVSWDERRKDRRGQVLEYKEAVLVWGIASTTPPTGAALLTKERDMTPLERSLTGESDAQAWKRNPNHAEHYTRNIRVLVDGQPTEVIRKVHPALIIEFNGQTTTQ